MDKELAHPLLEDSNFSKELLAFEDIFSQWGNHELGPFL